MNIGIYDPYLDDGGGGEKYMMTIAECLAKHHAVSIFWDHPDDLTAVAKRFSLDLRDTRCVPNIFSPHVPVWKRLFFTAKYDVVIFLSDGSIPLTLAKKLFVHIQQPLQTAEQGLLKQARVSRIFYNSVFTQQCNENFFSHVKDRVIYPPVSIYSKNSVKENIILHVGRFRINDQWEGDYKKQFVMVATFKKMIDTGTKGWKFILAVSVRDKDKEAFAQLQEKAKGYPISFFVNKSNDELWELYNKAKIYWHASGYGEDIQKHPEYTEHFGISTVEAMGAGAVPVVINAGGQPEIVTDKVNGLLWKTLDELQEKTKQLMKDHSLWEKLSRNAKERAKEFSKERFCGEIQKLVQS